MGIIMLQEGIREEKYKFFFAFVLSEENDWKVEVYFDEHEEEDLKDELQVLVLWKQEGQCCINRDLDQIPC